MASRCQPLGAFNLRLRLLTSLVLVAHCALPLPCVAAPLPERSPAEEVARLMAFLEQPAGPFAQFAAALKRTEVPSLLWESLANGTRFTLLAPTDAAFARLAAQHPRLCADADSRLTLAATHFVGGRFPFSRIALKAPGFEFRTEGVDLVRLPDAALQHGKRRVLLAVIDAPLVLPPLANTGGSDQGTEAQGQGNSRAAATAAVPSAAGAEVVVGPGPAGALAAAERAKRLAARGHVVRPNVLISRQMVVHGIDAVLAPNYVLNC
ncbi:hypothetical protein CLOM_g3688 [Closterium sp. NIES-68]|nr:hypothetical protein CLOM_g3688 [Closterium sp. NIES-68]GJP63797.1 hypothetical protein CLOP_g20841 [Closterium sp. NIES-67]